MEKQTIYSKKPISLLEPQNYTIHLLSPPEDIHLEEAVTDICCLFSSEELIRDPWLQSYIRELVSRWGRWTLRGRAPSLCFEAACVGGQKFLEKSNLAANESTAKVDKAFAIALAGMIVNAVEPDAIDGPVRNKAIQIVADEFLAKAISPQVSGPAQRRMKARKTVFIPDNDEYYDHSETGTDIGSTIDDSSDDEAFSPFAPSRNESFSSTVIVQPRFRSPSLPNTSLGIEDSDRFMLGSSSARIRSSSTSSKSDIDARRGTPSSSKFSDILDSVINEVESYLDILTDKTDDQKRKSRKKTFESSEKDS